MPPEQVGSATTIAASATPRPQGCGNAVRLDFDREQHAQS
jgi:hypothetical protein